MSATGVVVLLLFGVVAFVVASFGLSALIHALWAPWPTGLGTLAVAIFLQAVGLGIKVNLK